MQGNPIATRPIRRKLTSLAWLLAGAALPALAQTPSAPRETPLPQSMAESMSRSSSRRSKQ
ncbi:hypothetical protein [Ralstonia pseudosolanacearum]|uniref:hypothetical protein n=1 Tax=Ralstonia pseudosolanacearum TaxID=1310165 RepID=UPI00399D757D